MNSEYVTDSDHFADIEILGTSHTQNNCAPYMRRMRACMCGYMRGITGIHRDYAISNYKAIAELVVE